MVSERRHLGRNGKFCLISFSVKSDFQEQKTQETLPCSSRWNLKNNHKKFSIDVPAVFINYPNGKVIFYFEHQVFKF